MSLRLFFILFLVILPLPAGFGETPFSVLVLETEFKKQLATAYQELEENYRLALEEVQKEYASEGDLDGALRVRAELAELDTPKPLETIAPPKRPPLSSANSPQSAPIDRVRGLNLSAAKAEVSGNVKYDSEHELLVHWQDTGGANWSLEEVPRGRYEVYINYLSGPFAGGRIAVRSGTERIETTIAGSGLWTERKQQKLCELAVTSAKQSLALSILSSKAPGVMDVHSLDFVRQVPTPAPGAAP